MKLDLSTTIGMCIGCGMVLMGMVLATGGDMGLFFALFVNQPSSAAITIGGSLGGTIMSFPLSKVTALGSILTKSAMETPANTAYAELVNEMVEYATEARRNGVLALDAKTEEIS
ncbi:MAG: hypothetical protein KDK78_03730, partial [Chlamydiia bacterium]|nr:hypothetical protein [Chlamydiia bacterium]